MKTLLDNIKTHEQGLVTRLTAANVVIGKILKSMPEIVEGTVLVEYLDKRGVKRVKEETKSHCAWAILLTQILSTGYTNDLLMANMLKKHMPQEKDADYCTEEEFGCMVYGSIEEADEALKVYTDAQKIEYSEEWMFGVVKAAIGHLIAFPIAPQVEWLGNVDAWEVGEEKFPLVKKRSEIREYRDEQGTLRKSKVWNLTDETENWIQQEILYLRDKVTLRLPLCPFPLDPWTSAKSGVHPDYNRNLCSVDAPVYKPQFGMIDDRFDTGQKYDDSGKRLGNWSEEVLSAINKLQAVPVSFTKSGRLFSRVRHQNAAHFKPDTSGLSRALAKKKMEKYTSQCLMYKAGAVTETEVPLWQALSTDHRGRVYYLSGMLNTQGTGFAKSMLKFANKTSLAG